MRNLQSGYRIVASVFAPKASVHIMIIKHIDDIYMKHYIW